jgi:hypothetical protein
MLVSTGSPRYSRFCHSRFRLFAGQKTGKNCGKQGKNTDLACFRLKIMVLVFADSKFLGNVTPANSKGNLYFNFITFTLLINPYPNYTKRAHSKEVLTNKKLICISNIFSSYEHNYQFSKFINS